MITTSIIFDNYKLNPDVEPKWGFACLITGYDETLLFDTGSEGQILLANMKKMGFEPGNIRKLILSHDHWDHTGGLKTLLNVKADIDVYALSSFSDDLKQLIIENDAHLFANDDPRMIIPGVYTTGALNTSIKEQSLILETKKGLIIITGCAHYGIVNILTRVKERFDKNIYMVLGGFHLLNYNDIDLLKIIVKLKELGVENLGPCHCSGDRCRELFKEEFRDCYRNIGVGKTIKI